jgi:nucleoside phosphorylase
MRKNIFLHFMNRDTREIFGFYRWLQDSNHALQLREPLNAAAILCEDMCVAPPGFVIEDQIAFELFENQGAYLEQGLIKLPIREANLADFAEKKRGEYAPARDRYSGLFNDARMERLASFRAAITPRRVQIAPAIVAGFESSVDTKSPAWKEIRAKAPAGVITNLREVPLRLAEEGKALTWSIMRPNLITVGEPFHGDMRCALQHVYFREYCREFKLVVISEIPSMIRDFFLPTEPLIYNFARFRSFLECLGVANLFLRASADFIMRIRRRAGFVDLIDTYASMTTRFPNLTNLRYHTDRAVRTSSFDWNNVAGRGSSILHDPTEFELLEIADACGDLAKALNNEHGLSPRSDAEARSSSGMISTPTRGKRLKIALFVALEEELEVLVKQLDLTRSAGRPAAAGTLDGVALEVLCPRAMGRVAAAVETTRYLVAAAQKPDLIICVGLAGGFDGVDQGAVICVDTVVDLANRKVTDGDAGTESKFRRQDFACCKAPYAVAKSADFDENSWASYCRETFDWPKGKIPSLWEGKIASVDEVVASEGHQSKMRRDVDKLLGVEMEAGGMCAAASACGVKHAVIRVVSDKADPAKADDNWRKLGMKTLAEFIKRLPLARVIAISKS